MNRLDTVREKYSRDAYIFPSYSILSSFAGLRSVSELFTRKAWIMRRLKWIAGIWEYSRFSQ